MINLAVQAENPRSIEPPVVKNTATLFTVTVDTEEEWDWNQGWPASGFNVSNVRRLSRFQDLCTRYNIATTYFADLAVLEDVESCAVLLDLSTESHVEIGMHIHPWNTPPFEAGVPSTARMSFLHNHRPEIIRAKLETVYHRFLESDLQPTSFRGGRYSSGEVTQEFLREKGFWADASTLPFTTWPDDGAPDYRDRKLQPLRLPPSTNDGHALWEVPLTLAFTRGPFDFWRKTYEWVERSWVGKLRLIGIWERLGLVRKVWLNFESPLGNHMLPFLGQLRKMELPCICFTVHSSSLVAGLNPFTPTVADEARLFDQVEEVFDVLSNESGFRSATVTEVAKYLEEQNASSRN